MKIPLLLARLLSAAVLLTAVLRAEFTVSTGFDYSKGNYGLPVPTRITTIPFSLSYVVNQTTWEISQPYVRVDGPGDVVPGIGRFAGRLVLPRRINRGWGDLTLGVSHQFVPAGERPWSWAAGAEVKFGTADATKSLGTGEDDFATHVDFYYSAGAFTPFVTLGYRWLGNPTGSDLRNHVFGTIGVSWACTEKVSLAAMVDWAEKNSASGTAPLNVTLSVSRALGERWQVQAYGVRGTSDASADYGVGGGLSRRF